MIEMGPVAAFVAGSLVLAWFSRKPLRQPASHGFTRFFAWECLWLMAVINHSPWASPMVSPLQLISPVFMVLSIGLVTIGAFTLIRKGGGSVARGDEAGLYEWERTRALVTTGIFAYIRHPMYASLLALAVGLFCQQPNWLGGGIAVLCCLLVLLTARQDERECLAHFGPAYLDYCRRTRRFVPWLL